MATRVIMPKQGNTVESCLIASWLRREGDAVEAGEPLLEIETDKALVEVESPASGVLLATFFGEGDEVPVQTTVAVIGREGESIEGFAPEGPTESSTGGSTGVPTPEAPPAPSRPSAVGPNPTTSAAAAPTVPPARAADPAAVPVAAPVGEGTASVSPRARKLAARFGLEPEALSGSGPGGRVVERDVERALRELVARANGAAPAPTRPPAGEPPRGGAAEPDERADDRHPVVNSVLANLPAESRAERVPLTGVRRRTAERMRASLRDTAQLTLDRSADAEGLLAFRRALKNGPEHLGVAGVTLNDLVIFAVVRALQAHPELNALFADGELHRLGAVHLGFAVDTPRGLLVPVVHHADRLGLRALARRTAELVARSRDGRIDPELLRGGSFTVSNLGAVGIERFTPILDPPQVAILGVGAIAPRPVERGGEIVHRAALGLSLTVDHQIVDGAPAARFLATLAENLADPERLLLT